MSVHRYIGYNLDEPLPRPIEPHMQTNSQLISKREDTYKRADVANCSCPATASCLRSFLVFMRRCFRRIPLLEGQTRMGFPFSSVQQVRRRVYRRPIKLMLKYSDAVDYIHKKPNPTSI